MNPDLLHCRQILYHLNHQGSPKVGWGDPNSYTKENSPQNHKRVSRQVNFRGLSLLMMNPYPPSPPQGRLSTHSKISSARKCWNGKCRNCSCPVGLWPSRDLSLGNVSPCSYVELLSESSSLLQISPFTSHYAEKYLRRALPIRWSVSIISAVNICFQNQKRLVWKVPEGHLARGS